MLIFRGKCHSQIQGDEENAVGVRQIDKKTQCNSILPAGKTDCRERLLLCVRQRRRMVENRDMQAVPKMVSCYMLFAMQKLCNLLTYHFFTPLFICKTILIIKMRNRPVFLSITILTMFYIYRICLP